MLAWAMKHNEHGGCLHLHRLAALTCSPRRRAAAVPPLRRRGGLVLLSLRSLARSLALRGRSPFLSGCPSVRPSVVRASSSVCAVSIRPCPLPHPFGSDRVSPFHPLGRPPPTLTHSLLALSISVERDSRRVSCLARLDPDPIGRALTSQSVDRGRPSRRGVRATDTCRENPGNPGNE